MASNPDSPSLAVENVSVTYPNGHRAIENVTFTLEGSTVCALVGVNGSGKSTLFNTIMGIVRPQTGTVQVNGLPVAQAMRQNGIAYVPQSENIDWHFPILVKDVVMLGRYGHMGFLRHARPQALPRWSASVSPILPGGKSAPSPVGRKSASSSPARWPRKAASSSWTNPLPAWTPKPNTR